MAVVILHVYKTWNRLLLNLIGRATWEACSGNLESWEPSQHLLLGTGKPRKTCVLSTLYFTSKVSLLFTEWFEICSVQGTDLQSLETKKRLPSVGSRVNNMYRSATEFQVSMIWTIFSWQLCWSATARTSFLLIVAFFFKEASECTVSLWIRL